MFRLIKGNIMALEPQHQYENYSRHRIHFSGLFFAVIAFCGIWSLTFLTLFIFSIHAQEPITYAVMGIGQILCAFVAWRLMKREMFYANLMVSLEENAKSVINAKENGKPGARIIIISAVLICGIVLTVLPLLHYI